MTKSPVIGFVATTVFRSARGIVVSHRNPTLNAHFVSDAFSQEADICADPEFGSQTGPAIVWTAWVGSRVASVLQVSGRLHREIHHTDSGRRRETCNKAPA